MASDTSLTESTGSLKLLGVSLIVQNKRRRMTFHSVGVELFWLTVDFTVENRTTKYGIDIFLDIDTYHK